MSKPRFSEISIEGARTNNLKDIDLKIPLNKITCIQGPSGSGKSSLAFGTLVDESKRRYLNSLPNDIKFLWNIPPSADVDKIEPVLPVWALSQINPVVGSRPVVSDLLGITELLTRHFTLSGETSCGNCGGQIIKRTLKDHINSWNKKNSEDSVLHFLVKKEIYTNITNTGFPARSCKNEKTTIGEFDNSHEYWEISRTRIKNLGKALKRVEEFLGASDAYILVKVDDSKRFTLFKDSGSSCSDCGMSFHPSDFSPEKFNPLLASGACGECDGFGQILEYDLKKIVKNETLTLDEGAIPLLTYKQFFHLLDDFKKDLKAKKINPELPFGKMPKSKWKILENGHKYFCGLDGIYDYLNRKKYKRSIRILSRRLKTERSCDSCDATRLNSGKVLLSLKGLTLKEAYQSKISILKDNLTKLNKKGDLSYTKLLYLLSTANELGLKSLDLNRKVKSLSSGEYQRLLLVKILAQKGAGMLFVLDEPSRGLSLKEQDILISKLRNLKDQGNTIALVDHSEFIQEQSDFLIGMGPGAGNAGGEILFKKKLKTKKPVFPKIKYPTLKNPKAYVEFTSVKILDREFKKIKLPLNKMNWVVGDSGIGKSLFFKNVLYNHIEWMHTGIKSFDLAYRFKTFHSTNVISKINYFDPELRTSSSRSTVGTYLGFSEILRKHYSNIDLSKKFGLGPGHFSPNSELGKCLTCEGRGVLEIDMQFLENLTIKCEDCDGKKLKREYSSISDGRLTVDESYNSPLEFVLEGFKLTPKFSKILEYTKLLNLSHLSLSRTLKSLSGGERLRLQFLKALNLKCTHELFIFDNLSIGLSSNELSGVCSILEELKKKKNTIVVIDSNPYFERIAENTLNFNKL